MTVEFASVEDLNRILAVLDGGTDPVTELTGQGFTATVGAS